MTPPIADLIFPVRRVAIAAGHAVIRCYEAYGASGDSRAEIKGDGSPVTVADAAAEAVIMPALLSLTPDIPVISEESAKEGDAFGDGPFWLVDPLDGTKEYLKRNGEFTVNIALIIDGAPVLGVVYAPALGELFAGTAGGGAVHWTAALGTHDIAVREPPAAGLTVVGSRSHGEADKTAAFLAQYKVAEQISCGSSLKFCTLAAGKADLYPRFGPTCLWDTAAGHAVLAAAGGRVETADGQPLTYGPRPRFLNPEFIAYGKC
jgi:3'(2'), 5'-bisphosphate nucleotidase